MSNLSRRDFLRAFGATAAVSTLAACGGGSGSGSGDGAAADGGQSIAVCLSSEPDVIDPALNSAVDGATMIVHLFSGLSKWEKDGDAFVIVPDCAEELVEGVQGDDGKTTYTYKLREGLKWSDGQDLTANDFVFS